MKKIILTMFLLAVGINIGFAQRIKVTGLVGYTLSQSFDLDGYSGRLDGGWHYGGGFEFEVRPLYGIELIYQHQKMEASLNNYSSLPSIKSDVTMDYILLGGMRYIPLLGDIVVPYGGFNMGLAIVGTNYADDTRFAWGAKLGFKIKATKNLSFRAQAEMYSIVNAISSSIWIGPGGVSTGITGTSSIYQFGFTGGVSIGF